MTTTPLALTISQPSIFNAMGDFVHPEVLARFAKCSKTAHTFFIPIIERKKGDKQEMHSLVLRIFPLLKNLPGDKEASYYHDLLQSYFSPTRDPAPMLVYASFQVGSMLDRNISSEPEMMSCVMSSMRSAKGRRQVLQAIRDWRAHVRQECPGLPDIHVFRLRLLETLESCVRNDFVVRVDKITSMHQHYDWQ